MTERKPAKKTPAQAKASIKAGSAQARRARRAAQARVVAEQTRTSDGEPAVEVRTAEAIDAEADAASIRAADVRTAGRLRREGRRHAATEVMLSSLRRQADTLGVPTGPPISPTI